MCQLNSLRVAHENRGETHAVLDEVDLEDLGVHVEPEGRHRKQDVLAVDCLALLDRAPLGRLGRDERDELGRALLHALFRVLADFGRVREALFHDPPDIGDREVALLLDSGSSRVAQREVKRAEERGYRKWG